MTDCLTDPAQPVRSVTTVQERVAAARQILSDAGLSAEESTISARMLAEHVLGWDTTRYLMQGGEPEPSGFADRYLALVARRAAREPAAYITGQREFWGVPLEVSPAVLIPRPETELIVEAALEVIGNDRQQRWRVADACTGSGNVAIALALELDRSSIVATDLSAAALQVARRNIVRCGVADRVRLVRTNVLDGLPGPFDLIVANPPYVRRADGPALQPEVRDHEPAIALFGGVGGTEILARVLEQAAERLQTGGHLIAEFGFGQELEVESLVASTRGLSLVGLRRDLQGLARTAIIQKLPPTHTT